MPHESRASLAPAAVDEPLDEALRAIWRERLLDELDASSRREPDVELAVDDATEALREALERLDRGTFGWCVDCGQAVSIARLTALPSAARCLDCQSRAERRR